MEKIEKNEELVAEKPTKAIALKYDKENSVAPKVVAKGQGLIAENILFFFQSYTLLLNLLKNPVLKLLFHIEKYILL